MKSDKIKVELIYREEQLYHDKKETLMFERDLSIDLLLFDDKYLELTEREFDICRESRYIMIGNNNYRISEIKLAVNELGKQYIFTVYNIKHGIADLPF